MTSVNVHNSAQLRTDVATAVRAMEVDSNEPKIVKTRPVHVSAATERTTRHLASLRTLKDTHRHPPTTMATYLI